MLSSRLNRFSDEEQEQLINWGYAPADAAMRRHILKITPSSDSEMKFKTLPPTYMSYRYGQGSLLKSMSFAIEKTDNLPDRCESIAHSIVDNLKIQEQEDKGSPVSPSDNHIALIFFMLSHYVADGHMPLHCDSRRFSEGMNLHGFIEGKWEDMIESYYKIDRDNKRFFYDPYGYPLRDQSREQEHQLSPIKQVFDALGQREFNVSWGGDNKNVWDFMSAVCQHSYLLAYCFLPQPYTDHDVTLDNWQSLGSISFKDLTVAVFSDAIDSIARIWLRIWRRYMQWEADQKRTKPS